jgi:aminoglycoside phosphotransferase (APT) family kinase protein
VGICCPLYERGVLTIAGSPVLPGAGEPLRVWLCELFASDVQVSALVRLSGGAIQDNWALDVVVNDGDDAGEHALVLRADAPSAIAASLSRSDEFAVLRVAYGVGVCVPEPLGLCEDCSVLGRPFYAMRRIAGDASGHRLVRHFRALARLDGDALVCRLGQELARLHQVRPPGEQLACLPMPSAAPAQHRIAVYRGYLDDIAQPRPVLEWALSWLERCAPTTSKLVLCHGDYRTGNYMVDAHGAGLTGILDWEFAAWSDPIEDLGWFCARCWRFGNDEREAGGVGSRAAFYRGYESVSQVALDTPAVAYWEVMAAVRWAILALQQGQRHLSGAQRSLELALTARMVPDMELDALNQIEWLSK